MHSHIFQQISAKFGMWYLYTPGMINGGGVVGGAPKFGRCCMESGCRESAGATLTQPTLGVGCGDGGGCGRTATGSATYPRKQTLKFTKY